MSITRYILAITLCLSMKQALAFDFCVQCLLYELQPVCTELAQANLLLPGVQYLGLRNTTEKTGGMPTKFCEQALAKRYVTRQIETHSNQMIVETPETFCRFLVGNEIVAEKKQKKCQDFYQQNKMPWN
ncbi:MAG: hypothetical protein JNK86_05490 [Alphaproteobacteria bacterium]|nr:hypothetical protein [Alphaproteobacteria bacterium]